MGNHKYKKSLSEVNIFSRVTYKSSSPNIGILFQTYSASQIPFISLGLPDRVVFFYSYGTPRFQNQNPLCKIFRSI